jgi:hypothetical protein
MQSGVRLVAIFAEFSGKRAAFSLDLQFRGTVRCLFIHRKAWEKWVTPSLNGKNIVKKEKMGFS